jgi:hypothetical protein
MYLPLPFVIPRNYNKINNNKKNKQKKTKQTHITHASTTMKYIPRTGKFANQLMYWFMSDASEPNSTETDHRWIETIQHYTLTKIKARNIPVRGTFTSSALMSPATIPNLYSVT